MLVATTSIPSDSWAPAMMAKVTKSADLPFTRRSSASGTVIASQTTQPSSPAFLLITGLA